MYEQVSDVVELSEKPKRKYNKKKPPNSPTTTPSDVGSYSGKINKRAVYVDPIQKYLDSHNDRSIIITWPKIIGNLSPICNLCGVHATRGIGKEIGIRKHIVNAHCELKLYQCPHCPFGVMHEKDYVEKHIANHHQGSQLKVIVRLDEFEKYVAQKADECFGIKYTPSRSIPNIGSSNNQNPSEGNTADATFSGDSLNSLPAINTFMNQQSANQSMSPAIVTPNNSYLLDEYFIPNENSDNGYIQQKNNSVGIQQHMGHAANPNWNFNPKYAQKQITESSTGSTETLNYADSLHFSGSHSSYVANGHQLNSHTNQKYNQEQACERNPGSVSSMNPGSTTAQHCYHSSGTPSSHQQLGYQPSYLPISNRSQTSQQDDTTARTINQGHLPDSPHQAISHRSSQSSTLESSSLNNECRTSSYEGFPLEGNNGQYQNGCPGNGLPLETSGNEKSVGYGIGGSRTNSTTSISNSEPDAISRINYSPHPVNLMSNHITTTPQGTQQDFSQRMMPNTQKRSELYARGATNEGPMLLPGSAGQQIFTGPQSSPATPTVYAGVGQTQSSSGPVSALPVQQNSYQSPNINNSTNGSASNYPGVPPSTTSYSPATPISRSQTFSGQAPLNPMNRFQFYEQGPSMNGVPGQSPAFVQPISPYGPMTPNTPSSAMPRQEYPNMSSFNSFPFNSAGSPMTVNTNMLEAPPYTTQQAFGTPQYCYGPSTPLTHVSPFDNSNSPYPFPAFLDNMPPMGYPGPSFAAPNLHILQQNPNPYPHLSNMSSFPPYPPNPMMYPPNMNGYPPYS